MNPHIEPITHIRHRRQLVFAAVQLEPPSLQFTEGRKVYEWEPTHREKRTSDVRRILEALFSTQVERNPDIIVFPEYSLPVELHEDGFLQDLADQRECIIVAGSYHEIRRGDLFRNNVCNIYIPKRPAPLILCKREASPNEKEKNALATNEKTPNIACLVWHPEGVDAPAGINVFLCRDYLTPFAKTDIPLEHGEGVETKRVSLLDWDHDGINIVVMNNKDPSLFEAAAAFDVRLLHGNRKLVLLVNASNAEDKLATALFGPTGDPERVRDVAARMPPAERGVLLVETTLWSTFGSKTFPDTVTTYPISYRGSYRYDPDASQALTELKKEQDIPHQRGVFHPALLGALQKYIVLEMFVARSTKKINDAFAADRVRHVSAAHVRGIEDVLIKKYVEHHTFVGGELPGLSVPHSYLSSTDFNEAFDDEQRTPHLKVLLRPEHFIKLRSKEVPQLSEGDWDKACRAISRTLSARRDALREIIDIAKGAPVSPDVEASYKHIFLPEKEDVLPIGREFNNQIRETYFLVQIDGSEANRFSDYIRENLLRDKRVRDICKIDFTLIRPEPKRGGPWFEFLLRLKCTVFEADDVLGGIHAWAGSTGVKVGTRSYDLWSYISRSSLASIEDSISAPELRLLRELFALDNDARWVLPAELRQKMAATIERRAEELEPAPTAERDSLEKWLRNFYHYVCLFNIVATSEEQNKYQARCRDCWMELYGYVETGTHTLWTDVLELDEGVDNHDIVTALAARLNKPDVSKGDGNLVRLLGQYYDPVLGRKPGPLASAIRQPLEKITPLRNETAHRRVNQWKKRITLDNGQFKQLEELDARGGDICRMIVAIARELSHRGLS